MRPLTKVAIAGASAFAFIMVVGGIGYLIDPEYPNSDEPFTAIVENDSGTDVLLALCRSPHCERTEPGTVVGIHPGHRAEFNTSIYPANVYNVAAGGRVLGCISLTAKKYPETKAEIPSFRVSQARACSTTEVL